MRTLRDGAADPRPPQDGRQNSLSELIGLTLFLAGTGVLLYRLVGPPSLPLTAPAWADVLATLRGSELPPGGVVYALTVLTWGVWWWTAGSLALRLGLRVADALAPGAPGLRRLRQVSNRLTLPVVRRVADGAVLATAAFTFALRPPLASAAPLESCAVVAVAPADEAATGPLTPVPVVDPQPVPEVSLPETYEVRAGDTLWSISARLYGTGYEFMRLVTANAGRRMPDGQTFSDAGLIRPGWVLHVPRPSAETATVDGRPVYIVQRDDTLQGIAGRFLGDSAAWPEIFALNRGSARLSDGRALTHPDLIWPGLPLVLPPAVPEAPPAPESRTAALPAGDVDTPPAVPSDTPPAATPLAEPAPVPEGGLRSEVAGGEFAPKGGDTPSVGGQAPDQTASSADGRLARAEGEAAGPQVGPSVAASPRRAIPPPAATSAAVATGAAVAGAAAAAVLGTRRLRRRRRLSDPPVPLEALAGAPGVVTLAGGFAAAEFDRALAYRPRRGEPAPDEAEPAVVGASRVLAWLAEQGVSDVSVVTVCQERTPRGFSLRLTFQAGPHDLTRLLELAPSVGARLGRHGTARQTADLDVELEIDDVAPLYLLPASAPAQARAPAPVLLPVGAQSQRHTLYANWGELGNVLVAGGADAAGTVLTSLVVALAARCHPDRLRLWTVGRGGSLPDALLDLPHQEVPVDAEAPGADSGGRPHPVDVLRATREAIRRRQRAGHVRPDAATPRGLEDGRGEELGAVAAEAEVNEPEIVLVVGELSDLLVAEDGDTARAAREEILDLLDEIGGNGPTNGVRLLAATRQTEALDNALLARFGTRFVLEQPDEAQSLRLLGRPDASGLAGAGELFLRVAGRLPVHARGFRVPSERLAQLARLARQAYGGPPAPPPAPSAVTDREGDQDGDGRLDDGFGYELDTPAEGRIPEALVAERQARLDSGWRPAAFDARAETPRSPVPGGAAGDDRPTALAVDVAPPPVGEPGRQGGPAPAPTTIVLPLSEVSSPTPQMGVASTPPEPDSDVDPSPGGAAARDDQGASGSGPPSGPLVEVQCFGGLRVSAVRGDQTVEGAAAGYQPWAILAFLAAQPDGAASTEALCTAIWPDVDPDHAATARLSPALSRLRRDLHSQVPGLSGPIVVRGRNGYCALDPGGVTSDAQRFVRLCERARRLPPDEAIGAYEAALGLYRGDLLARQAYEWVERRERDGLTPLERYQRLYHTATCELADLHRRQGDVARAVPLYRQVLADDPTAEDVARTLFRCYGQLGDRPALLREYQRLRQLLRRALADPDDAESDPAEDDAVYEPEAETVAVYREVLAALDRGAPDPAGPTGASEDAAG
jgi:nucleoid-associated protein YgaU/DNA-binding SARP family transcriptional activator